MSNRPPQPPDRDANGRPDADPQIPADEQPTRPLEAYRPGSQPPQGTPPLPGTQQQPMADSSVDDDERRLRLRLLQRLSATEVEILRLRCLGMTTPQMATRLGLSQADAATHMANILDKLAVTHGQGGTSFSRLMDFCPFLEDSSFAAPSVGVVLRPPATLPSQRAAELTAADDQALFAQAGQGAPPRPPSRRTNQGWIIGGVLAFVLVAGLVALLLIQRDDDDDGDQAAADPTAVPTETVAAVVEPTPTETLAPEEPTNTPEMPTETPTLEPTATETVAPTETVAATETPEPTATATEPAATATSEPQVTPTVAVVPRPDGGLVFEADWANEGDLWDLSAGWQIDSNSLTGDGSQAVPLLAPAEIDQPDYAVEMTLQTASLSSCDEVVGVFARVTEEPNTDAALVGYAGVVCDGEWRILSVLENERETLAEGDVELENETTLRLEVVGDQIRLFINGDFAGESTDDRWSDTGSAGIYIDGDLQVTIEEFSVRELDAAN